MKTSNHARYMVKSLVHASRILEAFQIAGDVLRLRDVVTRTGFNKGMCFRLLYTLHQCGFLDKVGENHYRLASEVRRRRLYRIGYAAQGQDTSFDREVRLSLTRAAEREHVELITVDNRYQPKIALRSADYLIREQVDLVIEFQTDELIAPAIASKYMEANIPFIAIDIPHPGATYFGANNYQAGLTGGTLSGALGQETWGGEMDEILLVEIAARGVAAKARMRGMLTGIGEIIRISRALPDGVDRRRRAVPADARAGAQASARIEGQAGAGGRGQRFQRAGSDARISGGGAGQRLRDGGPERGTGSARGTAHGEHAADRVGGLLPGEVRRRIDASGAGYSGAARVVPPAVFTNHQLITPENVDHFYPNDSLLTIPA